MTTNNNYLGISHREIQALGKVNGEAMRLYIAVASFAYGPKTVCHPQWWQIAERIGKKLDKSNGRKLASQLEKAGLVKRGEFGQPDRWRLILKEQIIKERGGKINPQGGSNLPSTGSENDTPKGLISPPLNNKNKEEKKDYSLENKEEAQTEETDWAAEAFLMLEVGPRSIVAISNDIVRNPRCILSYSSKDRAAIKRRLIDEGLDVLVMQINEVLYPGRR